VSRRPNSGCLAGRTTMRRRRAVSTAAANRPESAADLSAPGSFRRGVAQGASSMNSATIATLPGVEPQAPELLPILQLHRGRDGVVTFHRKSAETGAFENLLGIRAGDLPTEFAGFQSELDRDSYFSINAFWSRDAKNKFPSAVEARQPRRLRYLCAAYTDVDCHAIGLDFGATLAAVIKLQDEAVIPPASVIVRSGRGCWLLWFLRDTRHPGQPPGAFPEKVRVYVRIQRAIGERLASLGADGGARDPIRIMRVPGSINPKPGASGRVKFWMQASATGRPYSYTLDELAQSFEVSSDLASAERNALLDAERPAGRRYRGFAQVNARRLREFSILRAMRGGFAEGCRNRAVLLYASFLNCNGMDREAITVEVEGLAAECRPPLPRVETRGALKTALGRKLTRFSDATISDWLDIRPEESMYLERLPSATRFEPKPDRASEDARQQERYAAILRIIAEHGGATTSCRAMARMLRDRQIQVSHMQVSRDYKALDCNIRPVTSAVTKTTHRERGAGGGG
jgi:hypothetical protein